MKFFLFLIPFLLFSSSFSAYRLVKMTKGDDFDNENIQSAADKLWEHFTEFQTATNIKKQYWSLYHIRTQYTHLKNEVERAGIDKRDSQKKLLKQWEPFPKFFEGFLKENEQLEKELYVQVEDIRRSEEGLKEFREEEKDIDSEKNEILQKNSKL